MPARTVIIPLQRSHSAACAAIVDASEPWRRLGETIDFPALLRAGKPTVRVFVCLDAGNVAGFVIFTPFPVFARGGYLRAIAVSPDYRRQSIGEKLLSFAERETARHAGHLYLCVSSFNRAAQAFYRKCGYRKVGAVPGLIKPCISEQIFWKRLRPRKQRFSGRRSSFTLQS